MRKRGRRLAATLCMALTVTSCGLFGGGTTEDAGEAYPTREVRVIVPFAAGGNTDLLARTVAAGLEERLGQPVVVENRPGAGGANAYNEVLRGEPDGYTLCDLSLPFALISSLREDLGYTVDQLEPIGLISRNPNVILVPAKSPYRSAQELFDAAEATPGEVEIATTGATVSAHIEMERLENEYGVPLKRVPFDGGAPAVAALLGGNVDAGVIDASKDTLRRIEAGDLRPLAITSAERAPFLPDVPSLKELGYPELTLSVSVDGLAGPAGMPAEVTAKLEDALRDTLADPEVLETIGENYVPEEFVGGDELATIVGDLESAYTEVLQP
jgi:tripartite-type tricarboxylate transporter receptor subunit TctC